MNQHRSLNDAQRALLQRFGVAVNGQGQLRNYPLERLPFGWYANWSFQAQPERPWGVEFVQTVPVDPDHYPPSWDELGQAVQANPGALWIVGNEPECIYQGKRSPEEYAEIYHTCYTFLKAHDPTCQVAIGGVVEPTPLRLAWLERVLQSYQTRYGMPLPVDVWNIHNQILQEKRGDYGCDIPVGIEATQGALYPWWENDSIDHFSAHVRAFRQWMAEHGQRNKPLIISEYGVLYPSRWFDLVGGVSGDERVNAFMTATFDFLLTASDPDLGYPADGNRLVQRWMWFSLNNPTWTQDPKNGFNGNLCDRNTHALTVFGEQYERYLQRALALTSQP